MNTADGLRHCEKESNEVKVQQKLRGQDENKRKKKARCGESSQARYILCSLFMFDSTVVVPWPTRMCNTHIRSGAVRCEASCARVVLGKY